MNSVYEPLGCQMPRCWHRNYPIPELSRDEEQQQPENNVQENENDFPNQERTNHEETARTQECPYQESGNENNPGNNDQENSYEESGDASNRDGKSSSIFDENFRQSEKFISPQFHHSSDYKDLRFETICGHINF